MLSASRKCVEIHDEIYIYIKINVYVGIIVEEIHSLTLSNETFKIIISADANNIRIWIVYIDSLRKQITHQRV